MTDNPLDVFVDAAKADPKNWVKTTLADLDTMMRLAQLRLDDLILWKILDIRLKDEAKIANRQQLLSAVADLANMMRAERDMLAAQPPLPEDVTVTEAPALAHDPDLLERAARLVHARGLSGEDASVKLLFLCVQSRLLDRIVSAAVKGPSSAGKSWMVEKVLELFPPEAYYKLTAFSEHALAYSEAPLKNKVLVLFEADSMNNEFSTYLLRSLLSEGCVRYETVEKNEKGQLRGKLIHREGPTGLILTTTKVAVHEENETRLVSLSTNDSQAQTRRVMIETARQRMNGTMPPSVQDWWTLQRWLASGDTKVAVPFADRLAELIPPLAVRLRRDFNALISLIQAHALLHRATREVDHDGHVIATLADYGAVRELLEPVLAEALGVGVDEYTRETVEVVRTLKATNPGGVPTKTVAEALGVDRHAAIRRLRRAAARDFIFNNESRRGQPAKWEANPEVMPDDRVVLPTVETLSGSVSA